MKFRVLVGALLSVVALLVGPGVADAQTSGKQLFFLNSPEGSTETTVTAVGVFNGVGTDVVVRETFEEGRNGRFTFSFLDRFDFDEGDLGVAGRGRGQFNFNVETCSGSGSGRGAYQIRGGTGIFEGATGEGTFRFDFGFVGETDESGNCIEDEDSASGVFFAKLSGNLALQGSVE